MNGLGGVEEVREEGLKNMREDCRHVCDLTDEESDDEDEYHSQGNHGSGYNGYDDGSHSSHGRSDSSHSSSRSNSSNSSTSSEDSDSSSSSGFNTMDVDEHGFTKQERRRRRKKEKKSKKNRKQSRKTMLSLKTTKNDSKTKAPATATMMGGLLGLTTRHRILLCSSMCASYRGHTYPAPVPSLLSFLCPQFSDVTREEWDRSRIFNCPASMKHFRGLLARSVVVHGTNDLLRNTDQHHQQHRHRVMSGNTTETEAAAMTAHAEVAKEAMEGTGLFKGHIPDNEAAAEQQQQQLDHDASVMITSTDNLIADGKITQSRKFAAGWLTPSLRHSLGAYSLDPILNAIESISKAGYVCEELVASSSSSNYFTCAARCGRTFQSEQGLRQHMAALHAPPGTWLCRSCGSDCGTSQARTHHERYCAAAAGGGMQGCVGSTPTVGQIGATGKQHGPGVGKQGGHHHSGGGVGTVSNAALSGMGSADLRGAHSSGKEVDEDGSLRVPNFRGVWVNTAGSFFIKVDGKAVMDDDPANGIKIKREEIDDVPSSETLLLKFNSAEEAAKQYDEVLTFKKPSQKNELNFNEDGNRIVYDDGNAMAAAGRGLEMLGGGASSVVPALSVINIKDLPKHVKPLLRDPRQTSRTGGNAKRYVYAYRGVCRQARKGHDRWQSQISFGGTNHYLGTFDSEWDAAAIYAWAHLILYGEEATQKAQREGEEAAAAWEQEKKDIADGKIIAPVKPVKKKKAPPKSKTPTQKKQPLKKSTDSVSAKKSDVNKSASGVKKQGLTGPKAVQAQKKSSGKGVAAGHGKKLSNRSLGDEELLSSASERIVAARNRRIAIHDDERGFVVSTEMTDAQAMAQNFAMLIGLSAADFSWSVDQFLSILPDASGDDSVRKKLEIEFGVNGINSSFKSVVRGCSVLGRATKDAEIASVSLGLGPLIVGGPAGLSIDCHIGGPSGTCSEFAATIDYHPTEESEFQFSACNDRDVVTLNAEIITSVSGRRPIQSGDVCSVGARVFMFMLPADTV